MKPVVVCLVVALFMVAFGYWLYLESSYRYRITGSTGRYTAHYYTNAYARHGDCVSFLNAADRDSSQVCGGFTITRLHKH